MLSSKSTVSFWPSMYHFNRFLATCDLAHVRFHEAYSKVTGTLHTVELVSLDVRFWLCQSRCWQLTLSDHKNASSLSRYTWCNWSWYTTQGCPDWTWYTSTWLNNQKESNSHLLHVWRLGFKLLPAKLHHFKQKNFCVQKYYRWLITYIEEIWYMR